MQFRKTIKPKTNEGLNEGIRAKEVRVIFPDNSSQVLPTIQAIQAAKNLQSDLVVISAKAVPPVTRIIDYGKFVYQEKKQKHEAKKKQHVVELKELKFRPSTDDHDYEFKKNHAIEFLKDKNKVKAVVMFKGREVAHSKLGIDLLLRLIDDLSAHGKPETQPRQEGRNAFVLIGPK